MALLKKMVFITLYGFVNVKYYAKTMLIYTTKKGLNNMYKKKDFTIYIIFIASEYSQSSVYNMYLLFFFHPKGQIHNTINYVRDHYFFKRSQYPQLRLVHMEPDEAFEKLQQQELLQKFIEIGKVLLTWAILKNVDMVCFSNIFGGFFISKSN